MPYSCFSPPPPPHTIQTPATDIRFQVTNPILKYCVAVSAVCQAGKRFNLPNLFVSPFVFFVCDDGNKSVFIIWFISQTTS